ncbi:MAG TPA: sortase [Candidatus Saccharimonadales bacterium]|nr:sortase [Candidatus Saccharimonadales bacterium]
MKPVTFDEKDLKKIFRIDNAYSRTVRYVRRGAQSLVFLVVVFAVSFYGINFPAFWQRLRYNIGDTTAVSAPAPITQATPAAPLPVYDPTVTISKIGITAPIIFGVAAADIESQLKNGVVYYQDTALPGEIGNTVLVGHSSDYPWDTGAYKNIFALLDKLTAGDQIQVSYEHQILTYSVTENKIVKPNEVSVLKKTDQPTLTLVTCYPVGTSRNRLIIRAGLTSGTATGVQTSDPTTTSLPTPR